MLPGSVTGKPLSIGGTRNHSGATSAGCLACARVALRELGIPLVGGRAVLQGFGKVGGPLAFLLASAGMRVVAVSDIGGAVLNEGGLDVGALADHVSETGFGRRVRRAASRSPPTRCGTSTASCWCPPPSAG